MLGMALTQPQLSDRAIDDGLKSMGIECNKVGGQPSGVSLARFRRIVKLTRTACEDSPEDALAVPLLLRLVWEKAETKACLLDFLLALQHHRPVLLDAHSALQLAPADKEEAPAHATWLRERFTLAELGDEARPAQKTISFLAARTLNATGQSRVTLSLR